MNKENKESWEERECYNIGMCVVGCDCGHCTIRREVINRIVEQSKREAYQRAVFDCQKSVIQNSVEADVETTIMFALHDALGRLGELQALKGEEIK